MTTEQLRKLAEIAGISPLDEIEVFGRTAIYAWVPTPFNQFVRTEWQPYVKIEQAIMVAEGMIKSSVASVFNVCFGIASPLWDCSFCLLKDNSYVTRIDDTPAAAICAAALAIGG